MTAQRVENPTGPALHRELQQVLWAYYDYWKRMSEAPHERQIHYSWVSKIYEDKFGIGFHQSKLQNLARLGYLEKGDSSRGGIGVITRLQIQNK